MIFISIFVFIGFYIYKSTLLIYYPHHFSPSNTIPVFEIMDICGYQCKWNFYETDHAKHPERIMYASESYPLDAYDSRKATERLPYVTGDFVWTSMDYLGEVTNRVTE
jgi:hypothetical protein